MRHVVLGAGPLGTTLASQIDATDEHGIISEQDGQEADKEAAPDFAMTPPNGHRCADHHKTKAAEAVSPTAVWFGAKAAMGVAVLGLLRRLITTDASRAGRTPSWLTSS